MTRHRFPPPAEWQAFEDLCHDLFRELWKAPMIVKHGRGGEAQDGVDLYGLLPDGSGFGVQCKEKGAQKQLTRAEMRKELAKAEKFHPPLARYVFATTAERTAKVQAWARELTETTSFEVTVFAWDDVCEALTGRTDLLRKHFPDHFASDPSDGLRHYLRHLFTELDVVEVSKVSRDQQRDIRLSAVYIELDVKAEIYADSRTEGMRKGVQIELTGDSEILQQIMLRAQHEAKRSKAKNFSRRCTALEAVAAAPLQVLTGRGGSGKSTFVRYLCLCLAGELLGHDTLNCRHLDGPWAVGNPGLRLWPHDGLVPFFAELRRFVCSRDHFPAEGEEGRARHLVDYLAMLGPHDAEMGRVVRSALDAGALVVLDGLDETPAADVVRERLQQVIRSFVDVYPGCRVVVTSRPYAYEPGQPWRLDDAGFVEETLAPFDDAKIDRFVTDAYAAFAARNRLDDEDVKSLVADLLRQIRQHKTLQPLAEQPLLLTMMTDLHTSRGGRLPGARSMLFEESVGLLFDRWNERRLQESVASLVGMDEEQIRGALELLAFRVHRDAGAGTDGAANVPERDLFQALIDTRERYGNKEAIVPEEIRDYLNQRSGILIAESPSVDRFPHRFFQEYLAACHLDRFPIKRQPILDTNPGLWREVFLFLAGRLTNGDGIWTLLRELVPGAPPNEIERQDFGFERAFFAGQAIQEHRLWQRREADHLPKLDDVRAWLRRAIELGALEVRDRVQAGQVLGLLGDHRSGIGLGGDGLPSFEWVEIPAGSFTMGSEQFDDEKPVHEEVIESFRISRYPLTNAQYQPFIDDGGYTERWQHCWTAAGWQWIQSIMRTEPDSDENPFDLPNHPRVNVSWYEAVAYCRWISERTSEVYRLPTEAEWERSSRGEDGREYPWGPDFDAARCNSFEGGFGTTSAVGLFSGGESPAGANGLGILDASGNVLEWCSTQWRGNYAEPADDDLEGATVRVLRGGSFVGFLTQARCADRYWVAPGGILRFIGFRLVAHI